MYRYFFIAKNNMKKQKKDMITFFIMTFISAFLIFICMTMLLETGKLLDTLHEKTNSADLMILLNSDNKAVNAKMEDIIRGREEVKEYEAAEYASTNGKYRHKGEKRWTEYGLMFFKNDLPGKVQSPTVDVTKLKDNEIVLPIALCTSFCIGDSIQFKIDDFTYEFKIVGFNEDTYFCSPMNMGSYLCFVTPRAFDNLMFDDANGMLTHGYRYSVVCKDKDLDTGTFSDEIESEYIAWRAEYTAAHPGVNVGGYNFLPRGIMYSASTILPYMFVAIMLLFAIIIFAISLVIIDFSIKNFIMTNMKNTAIMEASGYTVKEMVLILLTQLLTVSGVGSIVGVAVGALSIGKVGYIMYFLLGLKWNRPINAGIAIGVVIFICIVVSLLTLLLGRDYKKTTVLEALRGGINAHNFKKNFFSFDKSNLPVSVTLALKETFGRFRSQLGIIFIAAILTVSAVIVMGMVDTFASSSEAVMNIGGFIFEDAEVDIESEEMLETINNMSTVEYVYGDTWVTVEISKGKKKQNITSRAFTDTSNIIGGGLAEGRWPKHNNEIMMATNAAKTFGVTVGDTVNVKYGINEESYIVCGLNQTFNNLGMMAFFTTDGMRRIVNVHPSVGEVKIKSNFSYNDFEKEFKSVYPDIEVISIDEAAASIVNLIIGSMKICAILIAVLTGLIIAFVESLIIRTQINREWRNLGVSKALGYTSGQLIWQTVLSNIPGVLMGIAIGLLTGGLLGEKGCQAMFSIFGYKKVTFNIYPFSYVLVAILIISVAMVTSALKGKRIQTLEPVKMITEE
jgi:ABC-type antimicrobial peptide transport system permease subunit